METALSARTLDPQGIAGGPAPAGLRVAAGTVATAGPLFPAVSWCLPGEWPQRDVAPCDTPTQALPGPWRTVESEPPAKLFHGWRRYRDLELVGIGGMGRVYRAIRPRDGRAVALKFLVEGRRRPDALREAVLQARIDHPAVLPVLDSGTLHGYPWFAMPYVEAQTLKLRRSHLDLGNAVTLMAGVARAVDAIHHQGVVHCDLNPRNVLLAGEGGAMRSWIIDFGIAQEVAHPVAADPARVVGTPSYMAPEQALGRYHRIDHRTDVYALGATLYELATGHRPFAAATCEAVLTKAIKEEPQPIHELNADVPEGLERVVLRCLEKDPEDRFASAGALAAALDDCAGGH